MIETEHVRRSSNRVSGREDNHAAQKAAVTVLADLEGRPLSCNLRIPVGSATMVPAATRNQPVMPEVYQGASPNARLLAGSLETAQSNSVRVGNAFSVSLVTHVAIVLLFLFLLIPTIHWSKELLTKQLKTLPDTNRSSDLSCIQLLELVPTSPTLSLSSHNFPPVRINHIFRLQNKFYAT